MQCIEWNTELKSVADRLYIQFYRYDWNHNYIIHIYVVFLWKHTRPTESSPHFDISKSHLGAVEPPAVMYCRAKSVLIHPPHYNMVVDWFSSKTLFFFKLLDVFGSVLTLTNSVVPKLAARCHCAVLFFVVNIACCCIFRYVYRNFCQIPFFNLDLPERQCIRRRQLFKSKLKFCFYNI